MRRLCWNVIPLIVSISLTISKIVHSVLGIYLCNHFIVVIFSLDICADALYRTICPQHLPLNQFSFGFIYFVKSSVESKVMCRDIYGIMMSSHLGPAIANPFVVFFFSTRNIKLVIRKDRDIILDIWMTSFVRFKRRLRLVSSLMLFIHCTRRYNSHVRERESSIVFFIFSMPWYRDRTQDFLHHSIGNHPSWNYIPGKKPFVLNS